MRTFVRLLVGGAVVASMAAVVVVASPMVAPLASRPLARLIPSPAPAAAVSPFAYADDAAMASTAASPCGGENQRACTIFEVIFEGKQTCSAGLIEKPGCTGDCNGSSGTCRRITACGGEGQRACTVTEAVPSCRAGLVEIPGCTGNCYGPLFDSSGVCAIRTACGGKGQRGCTASDAAGFLGCQGGLFEVGGCSGDCYGDNVMSSGRCTVIESINEPLTDAFVIEGTCSLSGFADMHMHQFGHLAHGGAVLAGKPSGLVCTPDLSTDDPDDETCVDQGVNVALKPDFTTDLDLVNGDGTEQSNWENALFQINDPDHALAFQVQSLAAFVANLITLFTPCPSYLGALCDTQDYFHGPHDPLLGDSVGSSIGTKDGATSNFGAPLFSGWPKWTSTTHQQAYYKWLERAWQGGMRLMTQLAVTNEALCRGGKHVKGVDCTDSMASIDEQIKEAYRFQAFIDNQAGGPGLGWYRIVTTPLQAREAIARGKLAVVLGIETAEMFNCYSPGAPPYQQPATKVPCTKAFVESEVDRYYAMGIRHVFPIHNFDNAFGAAATWQDGIEVGQRLVEGSWWTTDQTGQCADAGYGFKLGGATQMLITLLKFSTMIAPGSSPAREEDASCNANGLAPLGRDLIDKLIAKGMIIDVDHMSRRALDETLTMVEQKGNYPVVASHALFFDRHVKEIPGLLEPEGTRHERLRTAAQLQRIKNVGGMVAAMLKDDAQDTGNKGKKLTIPYGNVADDCLHSSKTFAHAFQYAVDVMGGPVALGSDFNGVAGHIGPRFGTDACGGTPDLLNPSVWWAQRNAQLAARNQVTYPFTLTVDNRPIAAFWEQKTGHRTFNYNYDGMAHVGMLPDFIQDLKKVGLPESDISALFGSAEAYVKMWERAASLSPSPDDDTPAGAIANTCSFLNIPDGNSPVISVPDDITLEATTAHGRTVPFVVTATDPQDGPVAATCNHTSGANFPVGTTPVSCSATDQAGNTATGAFNIRIIDSPPTIEPHVNMFVEAEHPGGAFVAYQLPATHDIQDGDGVASCIPASGQTFAIGHTLVSCRKFDSFGNRADSFFDVHVGDTTPPVVQVNVFGTQGQSGWHIGPNPVFLTWLFVDAVGVTTKSPDCTVSSITTDGERTLTCVASDAAGNEGSKSIVVKLDRTAPSITFQPPSIPPNANGWHNTPVPIPYTVSDAASGIPPGAPLGGTMHITTEGHGVTSVVTAADVAGNVATAASPAVNVDMTPPTITAARAPLANEHGWNNVDVTATFSCHDALSGLATPCPGAAVMSDEAAGQSRTGMVTDLAGNAASASVTNVNIDKTAPSVTGARVTPANSFGWNNTAVQSHFSAGDALSGVVGPVAVDVNLTTEGANQSVSRAFTDRAGNSASATVGGINIDLTPPVIAGTPDRAPNVNDWYNADVSITFACSDALSGINGCAPTPQVISEEGAGLSRSAQASDLAGNTASATVSGINLDKTPPVVTCTSNAPSLWPPNHKMVAVQFGVEVDGGISGASGFTLMNATSNEPDNGLGDGDTANDIQGFAIGTADTGGMLRAERSGKGNGRVYSLLYQGADLAGNVTACTTTVTVPHDQKK